ncbi:hypothetical protein [Dokdonella sp.]|uniref:DNA/RNA non-specific endonuclease n=1 Tax=Dokdonella sp. TaxID=2291710 RepID=UPI001B130336|nr:hypothetical protein [Dokdonella sp.]MBO9663158.1 DNA/RNA non-specific endonuclease [Dokdonella sp.]
MVRAARGDHTSAHPKVGATPTRAGEDDDMGIGSVISGAASWVKNTAEDAVDAGADALKGAQDFVGDRLDDLDQAKDWVGGKIDGAVKGAEQAVDGFREGLVEFGEEHGGIVGKAVAQSVSNSIGLTEGATLAVYDMGKGVVQLADGASKLVNPLEWAAHGGENLQRLEKVGQAAEAIGNLTSPVAWVTNTEGNANTAKALWNGVTEGYQDAARDGDWSKFIGRGVVDVGSLFLGVGEANAAIKGAQGANAVAKVGEGVRAVDAVTDGARALDALGDAGKATRGADAAGDAGKAAKAGEEAGDAAKAGESAKGLQTVTETIGQNQVTWKVDANGIAHDVSFDLKEAYSGVKRSKTEVDAQADVAARGVAGDQGGHIVDFRFVLDQGSKNMFPQNANFNLSAFKKLGNEWSDWIKGNREVRGEFSFDPPGAARPDYVQVRYEVVDPATGNTVYSNSVLFENDAGQVFDRIPRADMPNYPN